jgi:hypothetical protein
MSMIGNERLMTYADKILHADAQRSESVCSKAADQFEDDLLEFDEFPDEYLKFVVQLLSRSNFYCKPGIWNFLLVLSTESHRLQPCHYEQLKITFLENYHHYSDQDLCLAVCDFIARNYSEGSARSQLNALAKVELEKAEALQGFAEDGMQTVKLEAARAAESKR